MTVFQHLSQVDRSLREFRVASSEVLAVHVYPNYGASIDVHLRLEVLAQLMERLGPVARDKSIKYDGGYILASFKARSIVWSCSRKVDLPTFEKLQAVFGGRMAGLPAPPPAQKLLALEGGGS